jgi:hypothetical protein
MRFTAKWRPAKHGCVLVYGYDQESCIILELAFTKISSLGEHALIQLGCGTRAVGFRERGEVIFPEFLPVSS